MSETEIELPVTDTVSTLPASAGRSGTVDLRDLAATQANTMMLIQRIFSFPAMLGALLVGGIATVARMFFMDPDVWWHVKFGQVILATHHWPTADNYSFSAAGHRWIDSEWIGEVLLATMYRVGGMRGLELLMLILGSAILVALYTLATIRSGNSKAGFLATLAVFVLATMSFSLRPQMLGYLFLIVTLIALELFRKGESRAVWGLPVLMLIWVNAHGSWIIGLGVIGVYLASGLVEFRAGDVEARRWSPSQRLQLASVFVLCICATFITPYGAGLAKFPFKFAFSLPVSVANISEWQAMPFNLVPGKVFLVFLLGIIAFQVACHFTWRFEELTLFLFAATMACMHRRFLLIFVPVLTPLVATILARWAPRYERAKDQFLMNAALMAGILAIVIWNFPSQSKLWQSVGKNYPVAAVGYLNNHSIPGPMYNTWRYGGYLILARGPEHKVFMDTRSELYEPAGIMANYLDIMDVKPDALSLLQKYGFQSCLLEHDEALATVLAALPDWKKDYEDGTSVLYVRRIDSAASTIRYSGAGRSGE